MTHFTCGELNENLLFSLVNCIRLNQRCDVWTKPKTFWKSRRHNYSWKAINFDSVLLVSFQSSHIKKKKKPLPRYTLSIILPYPSRFACCESDTASSFCVPAFFPILVFIRHWSLSPGLLILALKIQRLRVMTNLLNFESYSIVCRNTNRKRITWVFLKYSLEPITT